MFGPRDVVPTKVYADLHARCLRLEASLAERDVFVRELMQQIGDLARHAPRGETGRQPRAGSVKPPAPVAPESDLSADVLAVAESYAFGDPAQRGRNVAAVRAMRAAGLEESDIIDRLRVGEYIEPDDA